VKKNEVAILRSSGRMCVCACRARVRTLARLRVHAASAGDAMLSFADRDVKTKKIDDKLWRDRVRQAIFYRNQLALLFFLFFFFGFLAGDFLSHSTCFVFFFCVFSSLAVRPGIFCRTQHTWFQLERADLVLSS